MLNQITTQLREQSIEFYLPKALASDKQKQAIRSSSRSKVIFKTCKPNQTIQSASYYCFYRTIDNQKIDVKEARDTEMHGWVISRICKEFKCFTFLVQRKLVYLIKMDQTIKEGKTKRNLMTFAYTRILYAITSLQLFQNI